ncbi:MAG: 3D-(3,5/4)-trihydroxycyclohexane-1,2-dione acylhydrolase (decyclizing) [bacterium]|nr:3D-(3,5/4)-trihydroxycyclohexane-1,2-dione acylhydrolase (decyclizing) [Acidimicrobiia bacterium]MCY4648831.1 3D-(3,5/4)-trihydroxycyclohexane-1,2-dione acylhydrolase (decyclizing) [bacterium]
METIRLTMAQAVVKWLIAQKTVVDGETVPLFPGVFAIFGHGNVSCLGEALHPVSDRLPTWRGQNEQGMALAAMAFTKARRRRQIMVAASSIGPGCTNLLTAAAAAHANRLPILLFSGDTFTHRIVDPVLQQVENFDDPTVTVCDAFRPVSRYWDRITRPEQIVQSLPQALGVMLDPADCGPAFIALPQDVQSEAFNYPAAFFAERVHYIRRPAPDPRDTSAAAAIIADARQPLIIAGGGVHYSDAGGELTDFAVRRGIPVVETVAGKSVMEHDHPNYGGTVGVIGSASANALAAQADVVIAVGTRLQDFTTGSWTAFQRPDVRFVSINAARWDALKQHSQAVIGDARLGVEAVDHQLGNYRAPEGWMDTSRAEMEKWNTYLDSWLDRSDTPAAYQSVIQTLWQVSDPDDYCLSAAGGLPGELNMGWRTKQVGTFDCEFGYSTMGYEISGAWGAKMALPDRDVVAWMGDGGYLMMNSDIYSSVFSGHKVIMIVCDNGGFAVINRLQVNAGSEEFNNLLASSRHERMTRVDFVEHARSMGALAERVERLDQLAGAYQRAKEADRTYVIVIETHPYQWGEGGAWWEVGIPEVSEREMVRLARGQLEAERKLQRIGL